MIDDETKEKVIIFPRAMLDILDDNKRITGETSSSYIRRATAMKMVDEKLMKITTKTIVLDQK